MSCSFVLVFVSYIASPLFSIKHWHPLSIHLRLPILPNIKITFACVSWGTYFLWVSIFVICKYMYIYIHNNDKTTITQSICLHNAGKDSILREFDVLPIENPPIIHPKTNITSYWRWAFGTWYPSDFLTKPRHLVPHPTTWRVPMGTKAGTCRHLCLCGRDI